MKSLNCSAAGTAKIPDEPKTKNVAGASNELKILINVTDSPKPDAPLRKNKEMSGLGDQM